MSKIGNQLKNSLILRAPRVTEKSTGLAEKGAYVFVVDQKATKASVKSVFIAKYKVTPIRINIVNLPAKKTLRRGVRGFKSATKKAIVYLKSGDKIEIV